MTEEHLKLLCPRLILILLPEILLEQPPAHSDEETDRNNGCGYRKQDSRARNLAWDIQSYPYTAYVQDEEKDQRHYDVHLKRFDPTSRTSSHMRSYSENIQHHYDGHTKRIKH